MEFLNAVPVLIGKIIKELDHFALPAHLGFPVGKVQAGVYRLIIHFKLVDHQQSGIQIQDHIFILYRDPVPEVIPEVLITVVDLFCRTQFRHHGKLGTVHPVHRARISHKLIQMSAKALQHAVSEMVAVHFIDLGKAPDANHSQIHPVPFLQPGLYIFQKSVQIAQTGQRIHIALHALVTQCAAEIFRLAVCIEHYTAPAGDHRIFPACLTCPVLHIMIRRTPRKDRFHIQAVLFPVFRMNALLPDSACVQHIGSRKTEDLHRRFRPAGVVIPHITEIHVCSFRYQFQCFKHGIQPAPALMRDLDLFCLRMHRRFPGFLL